MSQELNDQELFRRRSLETLREMGVNPYPAAEYPTNAFAAEVKETFQDDAPRREVVMAGRLMGRRIMGKASFAELKDSTGRIQLYISRDEICPDENKDMYNVVFKKLLDIGDFIGVKGYVFRTQMGEISIHVSELTVLSKSLRPLPIVKEKDGVIYDAFEDPELRFRQRYVDLVVNEGVKDIFIKRNKVYTSMREYFNANGYMEV
jgi:lysyl-tRNA synthetase class 2